MSARELLKLYRDNVSQRPDPPVPDWNSQMDWNMSERSLKPTEFVALRHLDGIDAHVGWHDKPIVEALLRNANGLHWVQSYTADDFGQDFIDNYCHVELFGPNGHFANNEFAGGFVIYGPNVLYPNHWHVAEECYFILTGGSLWAQEGVPRTEKPAGSFVFHESNARHEMKIGGTPLLAAWWWKGGDPMKSLEY